MPRTHLHALTIDARSILRAPRAADAIQGGQVLLLLGLGERRRDWPQGDEGGRDAADRGRAAGVAARLAAELTVPRPDTCPRGLSLSMLSAVPFAGQGAPVSPRAREAGFETRAQGRRKETRLA